MQIADYTHLMPLYAETLHKAILNTEPTDYQNKRAPLSLACKIMRSTFHAAHDAGGKIIFVGNGGSAGIASHLAIDYLKNGGFRATAFNDAAALTCLSNDFGYENVFSKQIEMHCRSNDFVVGISSSGRSENILRAIMAANNHGAGTATFSGFEPDNPLRVLGDANFYVPSHDYGIVEIAHLTILHAILDIDLGWGKADA